MSKYTLAEAIEECTANVTMCGCAQCSEAKVRRMFDEEVAQWRTVDDVAEAIKRCHRIYDGRYCVLNVLNTRIRLTAEAVLDAMRLTESYRLPP